MVYRIAPSQTIMQTIPICNQAIWAPVPAVCKKNVGKRLVIAKQLVQYTNKNDNDYHSNSHNAVPSVYFLPEFYLKVKR